MNASSIFAPFFAPSSVASHGRSASGSWSARTSDEPEARAIERAVVLLRELLLAGDRARHVAILVAGLAIGVLLGALLGPAGERQRGAEQARAAERDAAVEVDARGAAAPRRGSASSLSIAALYASWPGCAAQSLTFLSSASFCAIRSPFFCQPCEDALVLLEAVLDALLRRRRLDRGLAAVLEVRLGDRVALLRGTR